LQLTYWGMAHKLVTFGFLAHIYFSGHFKEISTAVSLLRFGDSALNKIEM